MRSAIGTLLVVVVGGVIAVVLVGATSSDRVAQTLGVAPVGPISVLSALPAADRAGERLGCHPVHSGDDRRSGSSTTKAAAGTSAMLGPSSHEYTWVLADDDVLDFQHAQPVVDAIESGRFDAFFVSTTEAIAGRPDPAPSAASCETTTRTYLRGGGRRFWGFTFVPTLIFRTALFDSELMVDGYRNVVNSCPQFPFIVRLAEREHALFVAPRSLVHRRGQNDTVRAG